MRYVITLANSKLCKDNVNQNGWALTIDAPAKDGNKQAARRDGNSLYAMVSKADISGNTPSKMPVWRLIPAD